MKVLTYNINGIRAAMRKGLVDWIKATDADIICLQEIKIKSTDFPYMIFEELGYHVYLHTAQKAGYSGVAILSKITPNEVIKGCGIEEIDQEGRILIAVYDNFSVMSVYMPSGSSSPERQDFKMDFLDKFYAHIERLRQEIPPLVISGDYNVCHKSIDIHNPKSNANSPGFTPAERDWMTSFLEMGMIDTFRYFCDEPHYYSWWSYRANCRTKNLGWRIDYHVTDQRLEPNLVKCHILKEAIHSDHAPILLVLKDVH